MQHRSIEFAPSFLRKLTTADPEEENICPDRLGANVVKGRSTENSKNIDFFSGIAALEQHGIIERGSNDMLRRLRFAITYVGCVPW